MCRPFLFPERNWEGEPESVLLCRKVPVTFRHKELRQGSQSFRHLMNKHSVAEGEEAVAFVDGVLVGVADVVYGGEGADEHHEG